MTRPRTVPYVDLGALHAPLTGELLEAMARVLRHGQFILGPEVEAFEREVAGFLGVSQAVAVGSGTDALILGLRALGVGPGDEVVTVSHTFVATASAVVRVGARPVFVDIDPHTMCMDTAAVEAALTPRTAAILVVHLNGFPVDLGPLRALCDCKGLALVEDAAQAFGARRDGRACGTTGDVGCFSMHPLKVFGACGDAGLVVATDPRVAARVRLLRNLGLRDRDHCVSPERHSRLDALQAAVLRVKLRHVDRWIEARDQRARIYDRVLAQRVVLPPRVSPPGRVSWSAYVIRHPARDTIRRALAEHGIDARVHYPVAVHQQEPFKVFATSPLPVTEQVVGSILSLPIGAEHPLDAIEAVARAVAEVAPTAEALGHGASA